MYPLISVIVPVYNVAPYLQQCVESILLQSYKHLEILLIDDGSTDGSGELCDAFSRKDERIQVVHKSNGGLSSARNAGLEIAQGDWISFVDSDDWLEPELYASCVRVTQEHSGVSVIRFSINALTPKELDGHTSYDCEVIQDSDSSTAISPKRFLLGSRRLYPTVWNALYRSALLKELNLSFAEGLIHEDEFFTAELYAGILDEDTARVYFIPYAGYNYRRGRQDAITDKPDLERSLDNLARGFADLLRRMSKKNPSVLPLINADALAILEATYQKAIALGKRDDDLISVMDPFLVESRKYKISGLSSEELWLYRVFRWSPVWFRRLAPFYQPIARPLGSKLYQ